MYRSPVNLNSSKCCSLPQSFDSGSVEDENDGNSHSALCLLFPSDLACESYTVEEAVGERTVVIMKAHGRVSSR